MILTVEKHILLIWQTLDATNVFAVTDSPELAPEAMLFGHFFSAAVWENIIRCLNITGECASQRCEQGFLQLRHERGARIMNDWEELRSIVAMGTKITWRVTTLSALKCGPALKCGS